MKIEMGGAYTSRTGVFAREIIAIEGKDVSYRDFLLTDGQPLSSLRVCTRSTFRKWAVCLCTEDEIGRFRRDEDPRYDQIRFENVLNILTQQY